jgi:hypothetical protein
MGAAPIHSFIHDPISSLNSWPATGQTVNAAEEDPGTGYKTFKSMQS